MLLVKRNYDELPLTAQLWCYWAFKAETVSRGSVNSYQSVAINAGHGNDPPGSDQDCQMGNTPQ